MPTYDGTQKANSGCAQNMKNLGTVINGQL